MDHYSRHLVLRAPASAVYAALATQEGLRAWWSESADADEHEGGTATFRFGPHWKTMAIERLVPEREVQWRCTGALIDMPELPRKDEWVGTHIVFRLTPQDDGTTLLDVEHIGLTPQLACWGLCRDGWTQFLGSLQALVETGQGAPFRPQPATAGA